MLSIENENDIKEMHKYYRASDMIDFWYFFPEASPLERLAIVFDKDDYLANKDYLSTFDSYRIDSPKGYSLINGIESDGTKTDFLKLFDKVKQKNTHGVILFFDLKGKPSKRYERLAGISVNVNILEDICIEAVGQGFDGREISKGICVHERYLIPWFDLRSVNINNFKKYKIFQIDNEDYFYAREERIKYLLSLGLKRNEFIKHIPAVYKPIPDFIWENLIQTILVNLEKKEDILLNSGFKHFAIGGNTENKECYLWQMYNKDRYK